MYNLNHKRRFSRLVVVVALAAVMLIPAHAGDLSSSTVVTGTKQLISDLTTVLAGISLSVGGVAFTYCLIRKSMADEQDSRVWQKRMVGSLVGGIGGAIASSIVSLIAGYYGA